MRKSGNILQIILHLQTIHEIQIARLHRRLKAAFGVRMRRNCCFAQGNARLNISRVAG